MCISRYWLDPYSLFFIEVILVQFAELRRWQDFRNPGSQGKQYFLGLEEVLKGSGDPSYPGKFSCLFLLTGACRNDSFSSTSSGLSQSIEQI